jgi:Ca2+/Na+ antiporter
VLFVLAPFQGRGGIGNSVLGKIIGMSSWNIMVAVGVGSFLASVLFSFGFHSIEHYLKIDSTLLFGGVVIIAIFVVICRHFSQEEKEIKNSYTNGT